jgi:hypothetical protein
MTKQCVCGKAVRVERRLCDSCAESYGLNPAFWPFWLRDWMANYEKERNYPKNHREGIFNDDALMSPQARANISLAKSRPEMDNDEFRDFVQEFGY